MAAPLMSLMSPGTIKHVVPWKSRSEFLTVYQDLYSDDEKYQTKAISGIAVWKSRAGSKLSVAIESSGSLMQAVLDHVKAEREGKLHQGDAQLRSTYSLALIRFVNHITEKGQTKATAQPVHLVAREFGIPEWIVRLRHDATHGSLPCLDALATATKWALSYLQENFWKHQTVNPKGGDREEETHSKSPKFSDIRQEFYNYEKIRYQELHAESEKERSADSHSETLKTLHKYLNQNRMRFVKCLLEDGVLIATDEQLSVFGVRSEDLISQSPPTIPLEMIEFWRPLLKKLNNAGALPLLLHSAMFSVTSGEGIRNYQLVAWIAFLLSQCDDTCVRGRKKKRKRRKQEILFKTPISLPKKTLLLACLEKINCLTAHLLKYLADKESLGGESYTKVMKLLDIHTQAASTDVSGDDSDSETVYTVEDIKKAHEKHSSSYGISSSTVHDIQTTIGDDEIPGKLCTDLVDWSTIPVGTLPNSSGHDDVDDDDDDDDEKHGTLSHDGRTDKTSQKKGHDWSQSSDDNEDEYDGGRRKSSSKRRSSNDDSDESDNSRSPSPKRSKLIIDLDDKLM